MWTRGAKHITQNVFVLRELLIFTFKSKFNFKNLIMPVYSKYTNRWI